MKKILIIVISILLSMSFLSGCGGEDEIFVLKPITGIDAVFDESLGYYNESPSVIKVSPTEMYVYYTRNTVKFDNTTDSIAVRKAVYVDGEWQYGDFKTALSLSESGFDSKYIFCPDVIAGEFSMGGQSYSYLMAYSGSVDSDRLNAQIGFAVSNSPDGEFVRVGIEPIVSYDKTEFTSTGVADYKGVTEPSLISYDEKGKIRLFYSHYGVYNGSYCQEIDASDLDNLIIGGRMLSEVSGLTDMTTNTHLYSADWAWDTERNEYIVCRNYSSATTGNPAVAEAIQFVKADADLVFAVDNTRPEDGETQTVWSYVNSSLQRVNSIRTSNDNSDDSSKWDGYYRVYNGTVFTDQYGRMESDLTMEVLFTSSSLESNTTLTGDEYKYSQMIHYYSTSIDR